MKKFLYAAAVSGFVFISAAPSPSRAVVAVPPPATGGGGGGAGGPGGFIGVVGFLVTYDLIRRLTCSGDFLHFGGPGFGQPLTGCAFQLIVITDSRPS